MSLFSRLFGVKASSEPATVTASPDVVQTFSHFWGAGWDDYGRIYEKQPAVRTVVDFLSKNVAQLKPKLYERLDDGDRMELRDHALADLLRFPNERTTPFRHWRDTVADIAIWDRAYWWKIRGSGGVAAVVRIAPPRMNLEFDERTQQRIYRLPDGKVVPRSDLVIFSGYHPDGSEDGVSPLETLRRVLAEDWAAVQNRENMWRNAARHKTTLVRPLGAPDWSDTARERFRKDWQSSMAGAHNAGKTAILEDGMTPVPMEGFSAKDSDYIEGRKLTFQEVARAYAPSLVGLMSDETKANVESYHRQLYQDVLAPLTRGLEDEIELQLLPEFEFGRQGRRRMYVEFNLEEKLRGSFEEQLRSLVTAIGVPFLGVNEGRAMLNRARVDDATLDVPVKPLNVMYGNQPAVTVPTEDPGTPGTSLRSSKPKVKAVPRGPQRRRDKAAEDFTALFADFFTRQERSLIAALGAAKSETKALTDDLMARWNRDLIPKLEKRAQELVNQTGRTAAQQINGTFNPAFTLAFIEERARIAAESINQSIFDDVEEAFDDAGLDGARSVFEEAKTSRAERLGVGTATGLIGFARFEAAKQSQANDGRLRSKTWVVTSGNSRHPELNGETVPIFESFSNGMQYPGDGTGGADQTANCRCLLALE